MNDQQAGACILAILELAVALRDDGPDGVRRACTEVLETAGGDAAGALMVAACMIRVDEPLDCWWQRGLDGLRPADLPLPVTDPLPPPRPVQPCGTHAGYNRHRKAGEPACEACVAGERVYNRNRCRSRSVAERRSA